MMCMKHFVRGRVLIMLGLGFCYVRVRAFVRLWLGLLLDSYVRASVWLCE